MRPALALMLLVPALAGCLAGPATVTTVTETVTAPAEKARPAAPATPASCIGPKEAVLHTAPMLSVFHDLDRLLEAVARAFGARIVAVADGTYHEPSMLHVATVAGRNATLEGGGFLFANLGGWANVALPEPVALGAFLPRLLEELEVPADGSAWRDGMPAHPVVAIPWVTRLSFAHDPALPMGWRIGPLHDTRAVELRPHGEVVAAATVAARCHLAAEGIAGAEPEGGLAESPWGVGRYLRLEGGAVLQRIQFGLGLEPCADGAWGSRHVDVLVDAQSGTVVAADLERGCP